MSRGVACSMVMANRLFVGSILTLWIGSMTWLLMTKILPSLGGGEPPIAAGLDADVPVAWRVDWADTHVGYAATLLQEGVERTTEVRSRVRLENVPLMELAPSWMKDVVGDIGKLKFDAKTRMEFDSLDNFTAFESSIAVNDVPGIVKMNGRVEDSYLQLRIRSGELKYSPAVYVADRSALNEALFPDAKLPYLYEGRRWHEKSYNPFRAPNSPVEVVEVQVVSSEKIDYRYDDQLRRVLKVEYRSPPGPGVSSEARLQAVSWVEPDGTVLRQDVFISGAKLRFERLPAERALEVGQELLLDGRPLPPVERGDENPRQSTSSSPTRDRTLVGSGAVRPRSLGRAL